MGFHRFSDACVGDYIRTDSNPHSLRILQKKKFLERIPACPMLVSSIVRIVYKDSHCN